MSFIVNQVLLTPTRRRLCICKINKNNQNKAKSVLLFSYSGKFFMLVLSEKLLKTTPAILISLCVRERNGWYCRQKLPATSTPLDII